MAHNIPYTSYVTGEPVTQEPNAPAAGADFIATVPAGQSWILNSISARLVTGAAVANRMLGIVIAAASGRIMLYTDQAFTQTATLTETYIFVNQGGRQVVGTNNRIIDSIGKFYIPPLATVTVHITGIQAADQIDQVIYSYQRFLVRP